MRRNGSEWQLVALKEYAPGDLVLTSKEGFILFLNFATVDENVLVEKS